MASRDVCFLWIGSGLLALLYTTPARAGEKSPEVWDQAKAAEYLDARGDQWFNFGSSHRGTGTNKSSCVSCHSLLSYALARPVLRQISREKRPTIFEARLLEQTRIRVTNWDKLDTESFQLMYDFDDAKKKQSRGTEAVLNLLLLARADRFQGREVPGADTKRALSILWATQLKDGKDKGSWDWINFGMDPWEGERSRYMGASLAAIAVGSVLGNDPAARTAETKERLGFLREYLKQHFASENLHNRVWMLWASASLDGLLTPHEKDQLITQIFAKQQSSGGWSLGSLGAYARKDVKDQSGTPDGYATGLIVHTLQVAGISKLDPRVNKGLTWLRSNQDPTGAWRASSVNKNRSPESKDPGKAHVGKFMWDAATAYSVLALSH
jgi:squalene-hopene/tetraprenyl-beta-curcumene cyclase